MEEQHNTFYNKNVTHVQDSLYTSNAYIIPPFRWRMFCVFKSLIFFCSVSFPLNGFMSKMLPLVAICSKETWCILFSWVHRPQSMKSFIYFFCEGYIKDDSQYGSCICSVLLSRVSNNWDGLLISPFSYLIANIRQTSWEYYRRRQEGWWWEN